MIDKRAKAEIDLLKAKADTETANLQLEKAIAQAEELAQKAEAANTQPKEEVKHLLFSYFKFYT